jgi:hypothetical protein
MSNKIVKQNPGITTLSHKKCFNDMMNIKKKMQPILKELIEKVIQLPTFLDLDILKNYIDYTMGHNTKYPNMELKDIYKKDKKYVKWLSNNCYNNRIKFHATIISKYYQPTNYGMNK